MATVSASKMAKNGFDIILSNVNINSNGSHQASVQQWQYALTLDTYRLIGEMIKEQRATRKILERMDRRLAKRVKL